MKDRRTFIKQSLFATGALMTGSSFKFPEMPKSDLTLSLAEWSFNRALFGGKLDHLDFPALAKNEYGISVVEYVSGFFGGKKMDSKQAARDKSYLNELLLRSKDAGVVNHLIMVDDEGPLSAADKKLRDEAIENHKKWIEAAKFLNCVTVRVNLHGEGTTEERKNASVDSMGRLGEFAKSMNINVVVENHGSVTSNAEWVVDIMKQVNMKNVGTLPDFGNWCISHPWGTIQGECTEMYDIYKGLELLLPYAKGVSAKTYDFDGNGEQPKLDYKRLLGIVKKSGFKGYIGVEYEGNTQPEDEGVRKTISLIKKYY